jgi:hypothetical protein
METFQTVSYDKTIECRQQYGSHLVKIQRVRINIVKCLFFALDRFLQVSHSLHILDPNRKDTLCRFAKDPAIELKGSRHDDCKEIRHGHTSSHVMNRTNTASKGRHGGAMLSSWWAT